MFFGSACLGMARLADAWRGQAQQGKEVVRPANARQGGARHGLAGRGKEKDTINP